ncbi:TetR/AcrR family transcriptional regulator [Mycolicibacterium goodii]|uniref:Transcriptional regulator n=1 Tax=Mycolicibacterium goodii TaxID=134601 RepID=A0A0K0X5M7_MYCGD|nr:transcriptional regulator [Mycolicibacterium goodii]
MSRIEAAAATRRVLLDEAAALLDAGGPAAVTLREVGARAGLSRGAPYGHFTDKETLLTAVAVEGWEHLGHEMQRLRDDSGLPPEEALRAALRVVITLSRERPHLYQLMFSRPPGDRGVIAGAALLMCDHFVAIVAAVTGEGEASRHAAVLLTAAHGAAGLEASGLLETDKWHTTADELVDTLLATIVTPARQRR